MANPWGGELEDFAVFHFVDSAAIHTRSLVETSKQHMARQRRRSTGGGAPSSSPNHSPSPNPNPNHRRSEAEGACTDAAGPAPLQREKTHFLSQAAALVTLPQ